MRDKLPRDDYMPPGRPLADEPRVALTAQSLEEVALVAGQPDAYIGRIFSPEAIDLARAGRLASGEPGSDGSAVFREGVHPTNGTRYLVFPRTLPKRACFRLDRTQMRRFFPV